MDSEMGCDCRRERSVVKLLATFGKARLHCASSVQRAKAASIAACASASDTLMIGSRLFRLGMLLYGKAPNLPEIIRILRQK